MDAEVIKVATLVFELIITGFAVVLWANLRDVKKIAENNVKDLAATVKELDAYKLHVAETYVTSGVLNKTIEAFSKNMESLQAAVFKKLDRIEEKLDKTDEKLNAKVDKPHGV